MSYLENDYAQRVQASYVRGDPLVGPISASLAVTDRCNLECTYCPLMRNTSDRNCHLLYGRDSGPGFADLSMNHAKNVLTQLADIGVKRLSITGGEPLLRNDLEELITLSTNYGFNSIVLSNGTLLTKDRAQSLLDAGVSGFVISLDSLDPGYFEATRGPVLERVLRGIDVLSEMKRRDKSIVASVTCVLTKNNIDQLGALSHFLHKRHLRLQVQPCADAPELEVNGDCTDSVMKVVAGLAEIKTVYSEEFTSADTAYLDHIPSYLCDRSFPKDFRCLAAYVHVHINFDLYVLPCWFELPVGNLKDQSLRDIWNGSGMKEARRRIARHECARCWLLVDTHPSLVHRVT